MDVEKFINGVVARFIGTKHERDVKELQPLVEEINALEPETRKLSDAEITAKTAQLKTEVQARMEGLERDDPDYKQKMQEALQPALVPAFALVREAGRRTLGMRHFDVQLIGGVVLHQGKISEMATGEGKTLVATLPAYLNALAGQGVHIVTVNDYLARRDSEWMGPLYEFHGLSVDCIDKHDPNSEERRKAYLSDITFGTNNKFGFDYLRDNMTRSPEELVQRKSHFAVVDEVDSVLIDDARTPLIISGPIPRGDEHEFYELKPRIERLVNAQKAYVNTGWNEARHVIADGKTGPDEGGLALLRAYRGLPKSKALIKFLSEGACRQTLLNTENNYMRDQSKEMHK